MSEGSLLLADFKDIVEPRRINNDAVGFMTKHWRPQPAYKQRNVITPAEIKTIAFQSKRLNGILDELSVVLNKNRDEINKEVIDILEEIGLERKMFVVRSLGIFTTKVLVRTCNSVFVNEKKLFALKSVLGSNPVVFVPTHRSYADFILMTYLCYYYEIELPAVAAGMDFHSMVAMGRIMRDTCAFYIRRTFSTDRLYSAVFRQYVRTLVTKYHAPLSFFIEGTRSRSGKSLAPKFGFMSMVLEPFFTREIPDITFVPVHLSYNRVMEEKLFAYELLGVPKPKESTSALLRALSILNESFGDIYVNFGEPISAKDYFSESLNRNTHSIKPVELITLTPQENQLIQDLSHEIVCRQQSLAIFTTFQFMAFIINDRVRKGSPLSVEELQSEIIWFADIVKLFNTNVFEYDESNISRELKEVLLSHKNLICVDKDSFIRVLNTSPFLLTDEIKNKMKGHQLSETTMSTVIPVIMLQIYANPIVSCLINAAVISTIIGRASISKEHLWEKFKVLRTLLKNEFPYNDKCLHNIFVSTVSLMMTAGILTQNIDNTISTGNEKCNDLLQSCIWPFIGTLYQLTVVILEMKSVDEKSLVKLCQKHVENELLQKENLHPYSLSLDTISNCIQGFVVDGSLRKLRRDTAVVYTVNSDKMLKMSIWIDTVLQNLNLKFSLNNPLILNQTGIFAKL